MDIAGIVARNAVPVAGVVILGWSAATVMILYYIDTMVSLAALVFFQPAGEPRDATFKLRAGWVAWMGLIFGGWTFVVANRQVALDWVLVVSCLAQLATASAAFAEVRREFQPLAASRKEEAEAVFASRLIFVFMRLPLAAMLSIFWAPATVVIYAGATIYHDLVWRGRKFPFVD